MRSSRTVPGLKPRGPQTHRSWIAWRIHFDAFLHAPRPYLQALWWRLIGKRLRARAHFAPLLAASPRAYRLWLLNETRAAETDGAATATPPIIALVDTRGQRPGSAALDETLQSLATAGITALCVGTWEIPTPTDAARQIDWSKAPWIMPLIAGDVVAPGAADAYRAAVSDTTARLAYADDDLLDATGRRHAPHFKSDWNAELFRHFDFLTGACILRVSARDLGAVSGDDWMARLISTTIQGSDVPPHVPQVLHHRRSRLAPTIPAAPAAVTGGHPAPGAVTVIVPTRNRVDLLRTCLEGVARTDYPDMEVIVVDNGSDDPATLTYLASLDPARYRVLRHPGPFNFSALNNHAAREAHGALLCLLNNDIEVIEPDWLAIMAAQAMREEVGAVGARLLYPDGRIQHAGVVLGIGGGAAHAHRLLRPEQEGYFHRHALPQFVSAVTAACLVVKRERFEAVGGLDEANFAVAFNDVDFCMRLNRAGWQSLYEPRATLVHHESVSRGFDGDAVGAARLAGELAALKKRWHTHETIDPFHHPQLSPFSERFAVKV